jgi:foldase protein PrsA
LSKLFGRNKAAGGRSYPDLICRIRPWTIAVVAIAVAALPAHSQAAPAGVAATVDGKPITMSDVEREAMQMAGAAALDQLIQMKVIDDEARRNGITVTAADMSEQLQKERAKIAPPGTLEETLKQHHMPMSAFNEIMRHNIELRKLLIGRVKVFPLYHIRTIMVFAPTAGGTQTGPKHTDAEAKALIDQAESALTGGKKWEDVVTQYSEDTTTKGKAGDLGIINMVSGYDQGFTNTAATLKNGQISAPFKILDGYAIVQRISASGDHPAAEDKAYKDAESAYEEYMIGHLVPAYVQNLQAKARVTVYYGNTQHP